MSGLKRRVRRAGGERSKKSGGRGADTYRQTLAKELAATRRTRVTRSAKRRAKAVARGA